MPDNYYSEVNENGVVTPFRDLAAYNGVIANTKLIKDTVGWSGKNLNGITLEEVKAANGTGTWSGNVYTINSVPFTFNTQNGYVSSISCGNATASATITIFVSKILNISKALKLNGCPSGGGASTYKLLAVNTSGSSLGLDEDYGDGANLGVVTGDFRIQLRVYSGQNPNGKVFKPMIYDADILDSTYEPYFGSTAFPRSEQAVLGAVNRLENIAVTETKANVTFTVNENKTISLANTANANTNISISRALTGADLKEIGETIYLSGGYSGNIYLVLRDSSWSAIAKSEGDEAVVNTNDLIDNTTYYISLVVANGTNTNNVVIKPMIANFPHSTYAPFAMTNKELTDAVGYKAGDTVRLRNNVFFAGFITNGSKELHFTIPLYKSLANITGASLSSNTTFVIRGISGYVINADTITNNPCSFVSLDENLLSMKIVKSDDTAFTETNNTPITVGISGTLTLS